tara:strand:- start:36 stop:146 length:111 start_codon:yes stop_codon:yes gene_type:complete
MKRVNERKEVEKGGEHTVLIKRRERTANERERGHTC